MADEHDEKADKIKRRDDARRMHETLSLIGLRAQATSVGLVQLCAELVRADAIDDEAVGRIRDAIARDILVTNTAMRGKPDFEDSLRKRIAALFPGKKDLDKNERTVGTEESFGEALGMTHESEDRR